MACFVLHQKDWEITIPAVGEVQGVTFYVINIRIGDVSWNVRHRYKDFAELHDSLVSDHSLPKDILPPKKVIGNRDPDFIEKRRAALEHYLNEIVNFLQKTMPKKMVLFLEFDRHDIMFVLQSLSATLFDSGNPILCDSKMYELSILQVYAISERLKLPCPPIEMFGFKYDFSDVVEFCSHLETVTISGDSTVYHESNIDPHKLPFELSIFKNLKTLTLNNIFLDNLLKANDLRISIQSLNVLTCGVKSITEVLLCDEVHKDWKTTDEDKIWKHLNVVDLSNNNIEVLDGGMKLMPFVESLNINSNKIFELTNLNLLPKLQQLYLSCNRICQLSNLSFQLKCIKFIDLSQNKLSSLKGLEDLITLHGFNLASNIIKDIDEVMYVSNLPHLEYIVLTGNPISTIVDYRIKVLEKFGVRYNKICLDNEQSTQKELDTVAVLQALRYVKEGKVPEFKKQK